jgi:membrane protein required for colicin V production
MELTPTIVNVAVFGVILISAIFAYARGLTREAVTLLVWVGAALAAMKFYPKAVPLIQDFTDLGDWTKYAALAAAFVVALIILSIVGSLISRIIANSPLRAIDKGLGFLFGAARGLLLLAVCWIGYGFLVDADDYSSTAIQGSKGGELVIDSANYLRQWVPENINDLPPFLTDFITDFTDREVGDIVPAEPDPAMVPNPLNDTTNG